MIEPGPITREERAWALECLAAGDTLEEVAAWSGRPIEAWRNQLGRRAARIPPRHRQILAAWAAGYTQEQIAAHVDSTAKAVSVKLARLREFLPVPRRTGGPAQDPIYG